MANNSRIYVVTPKREGEALRLVDATNGTQAVGYVVRNSYAAKVATQAELVELVGKGVKVEKAGGE